MTVSVVVADLDDTTHQAAVLTLTHAYALDHFGNGGALPDDVMARLIDGLRAHPTTVVFLAFDDHAPVGIATCFTGFSTFLAKPLLNFHDVAVLPGARGNGVGRKLLEAAEAFARARAYGKLTLEVIEGNTVARSLYDSFGFAPESHGDDGPMLFYVKRL
ncbi:MAG: GNAT family N-acetyltransferase [Acidimicrobiia bacterium]